MAQAGRNGDANGIIQRAGGLNGQMLASVVNFFNPLHVFIGGGITRIDADYPRIEDGARGVRFIEKVVASSRSGQKRTSLYG